MFKNAIAVTLAVLTVCTPICADTVIKRNGEQIKGKIIEVTMEYVILVDAFKEWIGMDIDTSKVIILDEILRIYTNSKEISDLLQPYKLQRKTLTIEKRRIYPGALMCTIGLTIFSCVQYVKYRDNDKLADYWSEMGETDKSSNYKNKARSNMLNSYVCGFSTIYGVYLTFSGKEYEIHFLDN